MMKFLIQKCDKEIRHDFAFTLLEAIRFNNWLQNREKIIHKFIDTNFDETSNTFTKLEFKPIHKNYVPIGSIEFVEAFLQHFYGVSLKPTNIPNELLKPKFLERFVFNGTEKEIVGEKFVKSNDKIKDFCQLVNDNYNVPEGNYQISDYISIESEWRAFVYRGKLRGLQHYAGEFTLFPDVEMIKKMIKAYEEVPGAAPIAYTLDVGVNSDIAVESEDYNGWHNTFIIEAHLFLSCGLYGFADLAILPYMFSMCFNQYVNRKMWLKK